MQIATLTTWVVLGGLSETKTIWFTALQAINGMALVPERKRFNPLMIRELHAQIGADLQAFKVEFGGKASRDR